MFSPGGRVGRCGVRSDLRLPRVPLRRHPERRQRAEVSARAGLKEPPCRTSRRRKLDPIRASSTGPWAPGDHGRGRTDCSVTTGRKKAAARRFKQCGTATAAAPRKTCRSGTSPLRWRHRFRDPIHKAYAAPCCKEFRSRRPTGGRGVPSSRYCGRSGSGSVEPLEGAFLKSFPFPDFFRGENRPCRDPGETVSGD